MTAERHDRPRERVTRDRQQARNVYDRLSRIYDLVAGPFERHSRDTGRRRLDVSAGERVLEIGCGTGVDLAALARDVHPGGWCLGVDLSAGMLRRAARRLRRTRREDRATLVQADALRLPVVRASFDVVYLSFTLELFDSGELETLLHECHRVLRPTGRLGVVSLAQTGAPSPMTRLYLRIRRSLPSLLDCRPIPTVALVCAAGFTILHHQQQTAWGLPVDVLVAAPDTNPAA